MRATRAKLAIGLGACLLALVTGGVVEILNPTIGPSIRAVSADRLRQDGLLLANPFPWDHSDISQSDAEKEAIKQGPGGPVLQSVLAEVILTNPTTRPPRLCWVVSLPGSLVTSNGPPDSPQVHANFYLILIDAHTGEFVEGTAGG